MNVGNAAVNGPTGNQRRAFELRGGLHRELGAVCRLAHRPPDRNVLGRLVPTSEFRSGVTPMEFLGARR